jgi:hypothetical protein
MNSNAKPDPSKFIMERQYPPAQYPPTDTSSVVTRGVGAATLYVAIVRLYMRMDDQVAPYKLESGDWTPIYSGWSQPRTLLYKVRASHCLTVVSDTEFKFSPRDCGCGVKWWTSLAVAE